MAEVLTTRLDPVEGLVNYTLFTKPYHTKILEVLVEYVHVDCIDVTITEDFHLSMGMPSPDLLPLWGWTLEEGKKYFNCDFRSFQISGVSSSLGYFEVVGDATDDIGVGDTILIQLSRLQFEQFTVTGVAVSTEQLNGETYTTTISVSETITSSFPSTGVVFPSDCWSYDSRTQTYQFKGGIVWPSLPYVRKNRNCGGWGSIWDEADKDALGVSNVITGGDASKGYIEIDNTINVPSAVSSWADVFSYGVKVQIEGSTANDGTYEVLLSHVVYDGTPPTATSTLRIYFIGNIPSGTLDGTVKFIPWGYDEPRLCVEQGQTLEAAASIAENMSITLNDTGVGAYQGWDMQFWDMSGFDGGPFTYTVAFT